jgi:putative NADPH-quinone reductase
MRPRLEEDPMRTLLVLAHPSRESFNHAIAQRVADRLRHDGHDVSFHDLYAEGFEPLLGAEDMRRDTLPESLAGACDELCSAEALVIVHPSWWGQPPAILKGWVDRTFRAGSAYRFVDRGDGVGIPQGMLRADRAVLLNTANSAPAQQWGGADPLEEWWRNTVLGMCGVRNMARRLYAPIMTSSAEQRERWLADAEECAAEMLSAQHVTA